MSHKLRFFTGIQASGTLTLGNYLGLIHHILKLQEEKQEGKEKYEIIIMIADLHALTIPKKEFNYRQKCHEMAALLYACGLKENCKVFIQSEIKEHAELTWLLSPHITAGKLGDMIQFSDKKKKGETGSLALLTYPVLMAADIFLYEADLIIVGQDQKQHTELAHDLAQKFNNFYGKEKLLTVPKFEIPDLGGKIMGLKDPTRKMSKSENDYIGLLDTPEAVKEKFKRAKTDSEGKIYYDPKKEEKKWIANFLTICALLKNKKINQMQEEINKLNYSDFKEKVAEIVNEKLSSIQKNYNTYLPNIKEILEKNKNYLKGLAEKKVQTIKKVLKMLE
jgi:tryptophanyl-tRNA synthetase